MDGALIIRDVAAGYGPRRVLNDLSAEFPRAAVTVVLGPGGSGKSTLLRVIAGTGADLWWSGELPRTRAWMLAQPERLGEASADPHLVALARVQVELWLDLRPDALATEQRDALFASEVALMRASRILAADADLLLLDEPDASLAPLASFALVSLMRTRAREGATLVLVTHNLALVTWVADHVVLLVDGVKLDEGALTRLRSNPASERVRDFFTWGT